MNLHESLNYLRRRIPFNEIPSLIDSTIEYDIRPVWSENKGGFISDVCDYVVNYYSEDEEMEFDSKDKDIFYNFLVDTYGEYLGKYYDEWKKSKDENLSEQSNRIKDMIGLISEETPSIGMRRRVKMGKSDELIRKYKAGAFLKDEPADKSIDKLLSSVVDKIIDWDDEFSSAEYDNLIEYLMDFLYGKYKDELTRYYEHRQAERDKEEDEGIIYSFVKHDRPYHYPGWNGFAESFYGFDDLLTKYGHWLNIDWDEVKRKLDDINEYPNKKYNGNYSEPLRISSIGDEGNDWGYNFSILKKKQREY